MLKIDFWKNLFLFFSLTEEEISSLVGRIRPDVREYERREIIYSPNEFEKCLGFVIEGECEVVKKRNECDDVRLNTLRPNDSFGVLTLFSEKDTFPSEIYAKRHSKILFLQREDVLLLIEHSPQVSMNLIRFLSDRVGFLNEKIAMLSGASVERKLACHLFQQSRLENSSRLTFKPKVTAERINVGRASLYRALASLCEQGIIEVCEKTIIINDPEGLERMSK